MESPLSSTNNWQQFGTGGHCGTTPATASVAAAGGPTNFIFDHLIPTTTSAHISPCDFGTAGKTAFGFHMHSCTISS